MRGFQVQGEPSVFDLGFCRCMPGMEMDQRFWVFLMRNGEFELPFCGLMGIKTGCIPRQTPVFFIHGMINETTGFLKKIQQMSWRTRKFHEGFQRLFRTV